MSQHYVVLLLGSNLGDSKKNIENAILLLEKNVGQILQKTDFLQTKAVEFVSYNIFCNIALSIKTKFSPIQFLNLIKKIEQEMGRKQDSSYVGRHEDRIIDIDIVSFDNLNFISETLEIPHKKHLFERDFSRKLIKDLNKTEKHIV